MTQDEYAAAYREARATLPNITLRTMRELKKTYVAAGKQAAERVAKAELSGAAEITQKSWAQIEEALQTGAREIQRHIEEVLPLAVGETARSVTVIDETYLIEAFNRAVVDIDRAVVKNIFIGVNDTVIRSLVNRVFTDGYTYSERVWRVGVEFQNSMKRVITSGLASGRDAVQVARDLQSYVKGDRLSLAKRWGNLTDEALRRRIGSAGVDYRALRLVRSELYASLQDAGRLDGQMNPGCTGLYDWIRSNTTDYGCDCQECADNGPYTLEAIPGYRHPNCSCFVQPRLMDTNEFVSDLKRWQDGESVPYMDTWYRDQYRMAA
jgi:hypothetical protein